GGNHLELVHRDVSPQNVFVTYGGDVKLLDFGVATAAHRLTQTASGEVKGKYAYMSPEQCRGEPLDRRSDIFSLGIVLYELTTLRRLFKRANELQVMKAITEDPIPRPTREAPDYPQALEDICVRALARDPAQRYATAAEMRDDLLQAMQQIGLDGDPHEAIASKLARLFADRMVQKRELMERVRGGGDLTELLVPEVDEQVEVPLVSQVEATPLSRVRGATSVPVKKNRRAVFLVAFLVAVIAGAGVGAYLRVHRHKATPVAKAKPPPVPVIAAATPDAAPVEPQATGSAGSGVEVDVEDVEEVPPAPPEQEYIVVTVETEPAGVMVRLDGEQRGATPIDVKIKKATTPMKLELLSPGFTTAAQNIVPDRDQRMYFQLIKTQKTIVRIKTPKTPKGRGSASGFHRFD
ncbi:MAG TPA: protein kinase, partial [Kofleriaceae bacterium]|nr:protein kinase [Kofleriaceae bacterium]